MEVRIALLQQINDAKKLWFDINSIYKSVKTCCCRYRYLHTAIQRTVHVETNIYILLVSEVSITAECQCIYLIP